MNNEVRIYLVEYDCVSLITLMLWLDQFPEFEVLGTAIDTGNLAEQVSALQPDVVMLDIGSPGPEDLVPLRQIKSMADAPAVVLLYEGQPADLLPVLTVQSDAQVPSSSSMRELHSVLTRAATKRRFRLSAQRAAENIAV